MVLNITQQLIARYQLNVVLFPFQKPDSTQPPLFSPPQLPSIADTVPEPSARSPEHVSRSQDKIWFQDLTVIQAPSVFRSGSLVLTSKFSPARRGRGKPVKRKPVKRKPVKGKPVKRKPVKGKPVKGKPVKGKPVKRKPVKRKPVKGKPVKGKPVKRKPVKMKPVKGSR
ncbi:repetitive proline-rich cell wall protein 2-like [Oncorhynchus tshawytscha]|uniref:repetitive proline-rich cell wall protein 2-like n=1 Tax=Oncorhynchus tshawytscha TaxID=74940 RepID=UPI001C3CCB97|nr:repetitive proline-rich cell wall protein 2-like [Oncorhynchus tshawytscha]